MSENYTSNQIAKLKESLNQLLKKDELTEADRKQISVLRNKIKKVEKQGSKNYQDTKIGFLEGLGQDLDMNQISAVCKVMKDRTDDDTAYESVVVSHFSVFWADIFAKGLDLVENQIGNVVRRILTAAGHSEIDQDRVDNITERVWDIVKYSTIAYGHLLKFHQTQNGKNITDFSGNNVANVFFRMTKMNYSVKNHLDYEVLGESSDFANVSNAEFVNKYLAQLDYLYLTDGIRAECERLFAPVYLVDDRVDSGSSYIQFWPDADDTTDQADNEQFLYYTKHIRDWINLDPYILVTLQALGFTNNNTSFDFTRDLTGKSLFVLMDESIIDFCMNTRRYLAGIDTRKSIYYLNNGSNPFSPIVFEQFNINSAEVFYKNNITQICLNTFTHHEDGSITTYGLFPMPVVFELGAQPSAEVLERQYYCNYGTTLDPIPNTELYIILENGTLGLVVPIESYNTYEVSNLELAQQVAYTKFFWGMNYRKQLVEALNAYNGNNIHIDW